MSTGIGVIIEVKSIIWIMENPRYPAEKRYLGQMVTSAGEVLDFATDTALPTDQRDWKAIGRVNRKRSMIEISNYND